MRLCHQQHSLFKEGPLQTISSLISQNQSFSSLMGDDEVALTSGVVNEDSVLIPGYDIIEVEGIDVVNKEPISALLASSFLVFFRSPQPSSSSFTSPLVQRRNHTSVCPARRHEQNRLCSCRLVGCSPLSRATFLQDHWNLCFSNW